MDTEYGKLCLIAPKSHDPKKDSKRYFGYHRDAVYDIVFGRRDDLLEEMFAMFNKQGLTLDEARQYFDQNLKDNENVLINGTDLFLINRYLTYMGVPLYYDQQYKNPVNNRVADQLVDYLVDVAGWAKVQDRIYTADLDSYIRFYDYATKGYYIDVKSESLMYDFQKDEFMVYDNKKYAPRYAEDKAFCDEAASRLASARVELFRGQVLRDTEIRLKSSAEAATEVPETPLPKDPTQ